VVAKIPGSELGRWPHGRGPRAHLSIFIGEVKDEYNTHGGQRPRKVDMKLTLRRRRNCEQPFNTRPVSPCSLARTA